MRQGGLLGRLVVASMPLHCFGLHAFQLVGILLAQIVMFVRIDRQLEHVFGSRRFLDILPVTRPHSGPVASTEFLVCAGFPEQRPGWQRRIIEQVFCQIDSVLRTCGIGGTGDAAQRR